MFAPRLHPANGGVIVELDCSMVQSDVHFFGTILAKGHGVPWLVPGNRIAFASDRATPVEVLVRECPGLSIASGDPNERTTVYLVDQRDIHATVMESESSTPVAAGTRSFDGPVGR